MQINVSDNRPFVVDGIRDGAVLDDAAHDMAASDIGLRRVGCTADSPDAVLYHAVEDAALVVPQQNAAAFLREAAGSGWGNSPSAAQREALQRDGAVQYRATHGVRTQSLCSFRIGRANDGRCRRSCHGLQAHGCGLGNNNSAFSPLTYRIRCILSTVDQHEF